MQRILARRVRRLSRLLLAVAASLLIYGGVSAELPGGSVSYVALQNSDENSLMRISADGRNITKIADNAAGLDLALDRGGNYIIAATSALLRVTQAGEVSVIAKAPLDAEWRSVAVARDGTYFVADGKRPVLWRVSASGEPATEFAEWNGITYEGGGRPVTVRLEESGGLLVLVQGVNHRIGSVAELWRISQAGAISEVPISGPRVSHPTFLTPGGSGGWLITDPMEGIIVRVSIEAGLAQFEKFSDCPNCAVLARNPETGGFLAGVLVARWNWLTASGVSTGQSVRVPGMQWPKAVLAITDR